MVIVLWHGSDYLPELLAEQPENGLAFTLVPAEAEGVVVEDGAGGAAVEAAPRLMIEFVGGEFPRVWTVSYNLSCYCAQMGRLEECQEWFKKAMAIEEKAVQKKAIDDPDLKPLWDSMSGTMWEREG